MIPVDEYELNAYEECEYEATTLPHQSYERYPCLAFEELDEETQKIVSAKIETLKEFPNELERLMGSLGISKEEFRELDEESINQLLLEYFENELGLSSNTDDCNNNEYQNNVEEYESFYLKIIQVKNRTGFQETKDFPIVIGELIAGRLVKKKKL